jgi:hypothetical protein
MPETRLIPVNVWDVDTYKVILVTVMAKEEITDFNMISYPTISIRTFLQIHPPNKGTLQKLVLKMKLKRPR